MRSYCVLPAALMLLFAGTATAKRPDTSAYTLLENASLVSPGNGSATAAQARSTGNPFTWGAVNLPIPNKLQLRQLTSVSTDYRFATGSCWGGSPRIEVWVDDGTATHKIFFYIGPPPNYTGCAAGVYAATGNLASPSSLVDDSQIGGSPSDTYASAQSKYGRYTVTAVYLDVDGGWAGDQAVDFDNSQVNGRLVTYEA